MYQSEDKVLVNLFKKSLSLLLVFFQLTLGTYAAPISRENAPNNFADIVAPLLSAVVNISTVTEIPRNRIPMDMPNFPPGSPFEELFKHFFEEGPQSRPRKTTSLGSGFIISQEGKDALIVTCNHVIADADKITIILSDNSEFEARVVGRDRRTDLALLKISTDKKLTVVQWGDSDTSRVGEWIIAVGNPFGLSSTVTVGVISTVARNLSIRASGIATADYIDGYIQTDASINMGNSGGPMFNVDGKVIGVNTAILSPNGGSIGIGFAIPSAIAKNVISQLKQYGRTKRGWLGVTIQPVTNDIALSLGLKKTSGALVGSIAPNSPAIKAGIKSGDVILSFNGHEIKESRLLPRIAGDAPIGQKAPITVWRNGKEITLDIVVGEFEEAEKQGLILLEGMDEKKVEKRKGRMVLGMGVQEIKPSQYERFNVTESTKGLLITYVDPDSEAAEKGLRAGDIISEVLLEAARQRIATPEQFNTFVENARKNKKKQILLLINRSRESRYISLSLEEATVSESKKE
jgi:serine protease Do